jgi:hypothetical protein
MADLSIENILRLVEIHVERYSGLIANAHRLGNVRVNECEHYLGIWKGIKEKGCVYERLTANERAEVWDAINGGE